MTKLTAIAQTGAMTLRKEELTLSDPVEIKAALESIIEQALNNVARLAVLVG